MSQPVLKDQKLFKKVAFIGLGLIGSSLARVMIAEHPAEKIVASTRSKKHRKMPKLWALFQRVLVILRKR